MFADDRQFVFPKVGDTKFCKSALALHLLTYQSVSTPNLPENIPSKRVSVRRGSFTGLDDRSLLPFCIISRNCSHNLEAAHSNLIFLVRSICINMTEITLKMKLARCLVQARRCMRQCPRICHIPILRIYFFPAHYVTDAQK